MVDIEEQYAIHEDNNQTLDEYFGESFLEEIDQPIHKEDANILLSILKKYIPTGLQAELDIKVKFDKPKYGLIGLYEIIIHDGGNIKGVYALIQREEGLYIHKLGFDERIEEGRKIFGLIQEKGSCISLGNKKEEVMKKLEEILF